MSQRTPSGLSGHHHPEKGMATVLTDCSAYPGAADENPIRNIDSLEHGTTSGPRATTKDPEPYTTKEAQQPEGEPHNSESEAKAEMPPLPQRDAVVI